MATVKPTNSIHYFNDALNVIKLNGAAIMKQLEQDDYSKAYIIKLLHSVSELFLVLTNSYPPKPYYTLFSEILLYVQPVQMYLVDYERKQHDLEDIYELIQYVPMCLPRLYLMATVASAMSLHNQKNGGVPTKIIIEDIMSMSKSVQHSIRGLFLRHYISISFKHALVAEESLDLADKVQFIVGNLVQMIMLWIRWQHHGYTPEIRQDERQQLTTLIGTHFQRLTQLDFSLEYYASSVLPTLLSEIVSTQDDLAQEYLLQVIMDGFPVSFQLATLDQLLACISKCKINVKRTILSMLSTFTTRNSELSDTASLNLFHVFWPQIDAIMKQRSDVSALDITEIVLAMIRLVIAYYAKEHDYLDTILEGTANYIKDKQVDMPVWENLVEAIKLLVETFGNGILYKLKFEMLMEVLPIRHQMSTSAFFVQKLLETGQETVISDATKLSKVLLLLKSLYNRRPELITEETVLFCKLLHHIGNKDVDTHFMLLSTVRKHIIESSHNRLRYTIPTLVHLSFLLTKRYTAEDAAKLSAVFKFIHQLIAILVMQTKENQLAFSATKVEDECELQCMKLYLDAASQASACRMEEMAYEMFVQGFTIYETMISESRSQYAALIAIISKLYVSKLQADSYDTLTTKITLYAQKLLKRQDQCRCLLLCAHLFYRPGFKDEQKLLEILQRSIKVADACIDQTTNLELFVEILSKYFYFKVLGCETVTAKQITVLVNLISTNIKEQVDVTATTVRPQTSVISPLLLGNSLYGSPLSVSLPSSIANSEISGMDQFAQWLLIARFFKNILTAMQGQQDLDGVAIDSGVAIVDQTLLLLGSKMSK